VLRLEASKTPLNRKVDYDLHYYNLCFNTTLESPVKKMWGMISIPKILVTG
jgi:hypothetical protein